MTDKPQPDAPEPQRERFSFVEWLSKPLTPKQRKAFLIYNAILAVAIVALLAGIVIVTGK